MKRRIRSAVTATEKSARNKTANLMIDIVKKYGNYSYGEGVLGDITIREMASFPSIFVDLNIEGHMCAVIFEVRKPDAGDVEAIPPKVKSVKGIDETMKLGKVYSYFASVVQGLWLELQAAARLGKFMEG